MASNELRARLIRPEEVPSEGIDGGASHRPIVSREETGIDMTVFHARFRPGESHDWHAHEEDEVIYVVSGEGRYELEDGEIRYRAGEFILMPRGTKHRNSGAGEEDVILVAMFQPAVR
ncbi:MAG: cupin domain-containing protein [bacterium]